MPAARPPKNDFCKNPTKILIYESVCGRRG
jgi:hypothetical protein